MGVVFDKLGFMRKLEGGGDFTRTQAEKLTDAFYDAVAESVATKQDVGDVRTELKEVRSELKRDISELRAEVKHDISELRAEVKHDISELRANVTLLRSEMKTETATLKVWAVGTGVAIVSVMSALKLLN